MTKIKTINSKEISISPGEFPTLVSSRKEENGKLVSNSAFCLPRNLNSNERYAKSTDERNHLKRAKKEYKITPKNLVIT